MATNYVVYGSMGLSTMVISVCLMVAPKLYMEITDLHDSIMMEMDEFKILADDSWNDMMEMRKEQIPTYSQQQRFSTFSEFVRPKRASGKCRK